MKIFGAWVDKYTTSKKKGEKMKKENITIIVKHPDEPVGHVETVSNTLEMFQFLVNGPIEVVTMFEDLAAICNEEGRLIDLPHNCNLLGIDFVGTIVVVGIDGDEFTDAPVDLERWKRLCLGIED